MTEQEKCASVFRAVCEGKDCELSYHELEALEKNGYIADLKVISRRRWSFEWTDKIRALVPPPPGGTRAGKTI